MIKLYLHFSLQDGAILVFLPGWQDISTVHDMLKKNPFFSSGIEHKSVAQSNFCFCN